MEDKFIATVGKTQLCENKVRSSFKLRHLMVTL